MASARMICMSHLSDVQEEIYMNGMEERIRLRTNFVKYLLTKYSQNMDRDIDADADFAEFKTKFPNAGK